MQWLVLFKKEMLENWRNRKWIWVPFSLILIAVLDPISVYYLPQILEMSGGLPEGAVIEIPDPLAEEVIMMSLDQLSMFGVLIVVLISMGAISGERQTGVAQLILVKPISYTNYVTTKWASYLTLSIISLCLALAMSFYYISILFGNISLILLIKTALFYCIWFIFVLSLAIFYNTFCRTQGLVASLTIITIIIMSITNSIFGHKIPFFPNKLTEHIYEMLDTASVSNDLIITATITLSLSLLLISVAIVIFKRIEKVS